MRALAEILFICLNVIMAGVHANIIKRMERETLIYGFPKSKIKHGWWGLAYGAAVAGLSGLWWWKSGSAWQGVELAVCAVFVRKVFFDLPLNLFRGKPLFYVSTSTTSLIDRFHNRVFGNKSEIYMTLYFLICLFFAIYFLTQNPPSRWTMNL